MDTQDLAARYGIATASFVVSLVSSLFPPVNNEVYLAAVATLAKTSALPGVVLAASLGQMVGKSLFYLAGRGFVKLPLGRYEARVEEWRAKLQGSRRSVDLMLFASSSVGVPPFLVTPYLAGYFRLSFLRFLAWGMVGRVLRFGAIVLVPVGIKLLAR